MYCAACGTALAADAKFCTACGASVAISEEITSPPSGTSPTRRVVLLVGACAVLVVIGTFISFLNPSVHNVILRQQTVAPATDYGSNVVEAVDVTFREEGDDVLFSLDDLKRHKLIRFEYKGGKTPRPILAYIAPSGQVVTAISVSEHCGSTRFTIKENKIFCAQCPSNWDMMTMEAYACCAKYYPDPIPSRVSGDDVRIAKATIEKWAGRL
jgi:uncharacterized membrane protein